MTFVRRPVALPARVAGPRRHADREHQVGDPVSRYADGGVAQQDVLPAEVADDGTVALTHHHRDRADGNLVERRQLPALPRDGAPVTANGVRPQTGAPRDDTHPPEPFG